jgi:glycine cleavage system H protein
MAQAKALLGQGLYYVGFTVLAVVGLLLLTVVAVAMRPLLMIGFCVALVCCAALYYFSPAFRQWYDSVGEREVKLSGLRLATNVAVHPNHGWVRTQPGNVVTTGADDLVQATLGPVERVELPAVGNRVEQGDPLFCLRRAGRSVDVRSPVSGIVIGRNEALVEHPELVNAEPFAAGWAVRLQLDKAREDGQRLLRGKLARTWFRQETDRLLHLLVSPGAATPTSPDGGTVVDELYRHIDENEWATLSETFFGAGAKGA